MSKKVSFSTLGCKLNFSETSTVAREFKERGYKTVKFGDNADVIFINTCTVTQSADSKCRKAVRQAVKSSPDAFVVVTGCYAQADATKLAAIPGVDAVLGMDEKFNLFEHFDNFSNKDKTAIHSCETNEINNFDSAWSSAGRTRAFLKVQDGCDYVCTYCIIPKVRGKSRNKSIEELLKDAEEIKKSRKKEIILTGVNIGDFGKSNGENFYDLLKAFDRQAAVPRFRISSVEPNLLKPEIIDLVAQSEIFLPHFHIPLQSGSTNVLKEMKRAYTPGLFKKRVDYIKSVIPDAFLGIDVITGFPGESENEFKETYDFLSNLDISFLHVFSYSDRNGTIASQSKNKVHSKKIKERSHILHKLSEQKLKQFYMKHIGDIRPVLFEDADHKGYIYGFTDNYIKVEFPFDKELANSIRKVKIKGISKSGNAQCEII